VLFGHQNHQITNKKLVENLNTSLSFRFYHFTSKSIDKTGKISIYMNRLKHEKFPKITKWLRAAYYIKSGGVQ
jgi:hypothetical protein